MLKKILLIVTIFFFSFFGVINAKEYCGASEFLEVNSQDFNSISNVCKPLHKPAFGFKTFDTSNFNTVNVSDCDFASIQQVINTADNTGTIIELPDCEVDFGSNDLEISQKQNIVLKGYGELGTVFYGQGRDSANQTFVDVQNSENIVIENIKTNGQGNNIIGVGIRDSLNTLVQNNEVSNGRLGVYLNGAKNTTVRYNKLLNSISHHGVGAGDGESLLVYSNISIGNKGVGIDMHTKNSEVAGNYVYKNDEAAKFPDASNILIHNNYFKENGPHGWVVRTYSQRQGVYVDNFYFYNNTFENNNTDNAFVIFNGPVGNLRENIHLIKNNYLATDSLKENNSQSIKIKVCEGTEDYLRTPAEKRFVVFGSVCDLSSNFPNPTPTNPPIGTPTPTIESTPTPSPTPDLSFDHNNDDKVDVLDLIEIIKYLFQ